MSWFDGYIPDECLKCFQKAVDRWEWKEDAACDDSCGNFLAMFPVIVDGKIDRERMELLECRPPDPLWHR